VLLEDVLADTGNLVLPTRRLGPNGLDAWAQVLGNGYEGYVAKDVLSRTAARRRTISPFTTVGR